MGEAGPEAVLPLSRGRGGRLGVVAESASPVIQIIDQRSGSDPPVETEETTSADGRSLIRVLVRNQIKESFNDGSVDRDLRNNFGIKLRSRG